MSETAPAPPEPGNAVSVRGRPATVQDVRVHSGGGEACHLVDVEYLDTWEFPSQDTVLWERELDARVLPGTGWPRIADGVRPEITSGSPHSATPCGGPLRRGFPG
jgi:hypothetical protein